MESEDQRLMSEFEEMIMSSNTSAMRELLDLTGIKGKLQRMIPDTYSESKYYISDETNVAFLMFKILKVDVLRGKYLSPAKLPNLKKKYAQGVAVVDMLCEDHEYLMGYSDLFCNLIFDIQGSISKNDSTLRTKHLLNIVEIYALAFNAGISINDLGETMYKIVDRFEEEYKDVPLSFEKSLGEYVSPVTSALFFKYEKETILRLV